MRKRVAVFVLSLGLPGVPSCTEHIFGMYCVSLHLSRVYLEYHLAEMTVSSTAFFSSNYIKFISPQKNRFLPRFKFATRDSAIRQIPRRISSEHHFSSTPAPMSRSFTGCTRCKARRQKCDEQRPICGRCQSAGVQCKYAMQLQWGGRAFSRSRFGACVGTGGMQRLGTQTDLFFENKYTDGLARIFPWGVHLYHQQAGSGRSARRPDLDTAGRSLLISLV